MWCMRICGCPVIDPDPDPDPGSGGVEVCCHGLGPRPAVRLHGGVHRRHTGRLRRETHRAQHAVERDAVGPDQREEMPAWHHLLN